MVGFCMQVFWYIWFRKLPPKKYNFFFKKMNKYRIAAIALLALLLLPILLCMVKWIIPIGCNSICPNRNFFGVTVKDVPRPMPNPPCPAAPACPACPTAPTAPACPACPACPPACPPCSGGGTGGSTPGGSTPPPPPPPLAEPTTSDTTQCGAVWDLIPSYTSPDGTLYMTFPSTQCLKTGNCMIVEIANSASCQGTKQMFGLTIIGSPPPGKDIYSAPSYRYEYDFGSNNVYFASGVGGWPQNLGAFGDVSGGTVVGSMDSWNYDRTQLKICIVSPTQTDMYINDIKITSSTTPGFVPSMIGIDSTSAACLKENVSVQVI